MDESATGSVNSWSGLDTALEFTGVSFYDCLGAALISDDPALD